MNGVAKCAAMHRSKEDKAITEADIANNNLILWGDPGSNSVIAKVLAKLPITWTKDALELNKQSHKANAAMPVLIYPNPLNPKRYIVLNSGLHLPRIRLPEQCPTSGQTARLGRHRPHQAQDPTSPRRHRRCWILRRSLAVEGGTEEIVDRIASIVTVRPF